MKPIQIDEYTAVDSRGELHRVQVMQHSRPGRSHIGDSPAEDAEATTLKFIVDGNHQVEQDPRDPDAVAVPRFGKLTRQF